MNAGVDDLSWRTRPWVWRRRGSRRTPPGRGTGVRTPRGARDRARRRGPSARDGRRRAGSGTGSSRTSAEVAAVERRAEPTGANPDDARGAPTGIAQRGTRGRRCGRRRAARAAARRGTKRPTRMVRRCRTRERERDGHHLRGARPRVASGPGQRFSALTTRRARLRRPPLQRVDRPHVTYLDFEPPGSATWSTRRRRPHRARSRASSARARRD